MLWKRNEKLIFILFKVLPLKEIKPTFSEGEIPTLCQAIAVSNDSFVGNITSCDMNAFDTSLADCNRLKRHENVFSPLNLVQPNWSVY